MLCAVFKEENLLSFNFFRFVGDQEAWHELSELYINEHE